MGGHFVGMDPPKWADVSVVCCVILWAWSVGVVWSASPTQFCLTNEKLLPPPLFLFQFKRDYSALRKQILIKIGSYFPEVPAWKSYYIYYSIKAYNIQNSLTTPPPLTIFYLESLDFVPKQLQPHNQVSLAYYSSYYPGSH